MYTTGFLALAATLATATAQNIRGFNYGSTFTTGAPKQEADFQNEFRTAQNLVGASGFTSARLYTTIQAGTPNNPISAIPAAIATKTTLLLGLWGSAGQDNFNNEIAALKSAIDQYGTAFTSLVTGISVGSEDLYRSSPIGVAANAGVGVGADAIIKYINQVRDAIAGTSLSGASVGHVDTWTAWVDPSNVGVISACDWLGMDAYPYFQNTEVNDIGVSKDVFYQAYYNTTGVANGKSVWVTETGWPVSGPTENLAVPSTQNAQTYWNTVGCSLFGNVNTYWYTLQDAAPDTPSPSFGIVGSTLSTTPLYDLTCSAVASSSSSSSSSASATPSATSGSATASVASSVGASAIASGAPASSAGSGPIVGSAASSAASFAASSGAPATGDSTPTAAPATSVVYTTQEVTVTSCGASVTDCPAVTTMTTYPVATSVVTASSASIVAPTPPGIVVNNSTTFTNFPVTTVTGPVGPSTITMTPTASFGTGFIPSGTGSPSSSPIAPVSPGSAASVSVGGVTAALMAVFALFATL